MSTVESEQADLVDAIGNALENAGAKVERNVSIPGGGRAKIAVTATEDQIKDAADSASAPESVGGVSKGQLRSFIERIERIEEEKAALSSDVREVYAEAKANGYDPKIMRQVIKLRKMDGNERAEQEALLDVYLCALGMVG